MASIFGHAIVAGAMGCTLSDKVRSAKVVFIGMCCSMMPDLDVFLFNFGIRYGDLWGHRGMTHSVFFGICFGILMGLIFHYKMELRNRLKVIVYYVLCTVSHGLLDGLTTGGMGVAYFSPFDTERYFLPWRMIKVSPLGIKRFFSDRGLEVLQSEFIWLGIPSIALLILCLTLGKINRISH